MNKRKNGKLWAVMGCMALLLLAALVSGGFLRLRPSEKEASDRDGTQGQVEAWEPTLYLFDSGNGGHLLRNDLPQAEELRWWNGQTIKAEDAEPRYRIEIAGTAYEGTYRDSGYRLHTSYRTDYYVTPDGETFGIRSDTKEPVSLDLHTQRFEQLQNDLEPLENPGEELKRLAEEIASIWIHPAEYECLGPEIAMVPGVDPVLFTYRFVNMIGGMESSDCVTVVLTNRGTLAQLFVGELGWADGLQIFPDADIASLVTDSGLLANPAIRRQILALSPTGDPICWIEVTGTAKEGTGTSISLILK